MWICFFSDTAAVDSNHSVREIVFGLDCYGSSGTQLKAVKLFGFIALLLKPTIGCTGVGEYEVKQTSRSHKTAGGNLASCNAYDI